MTRLYLLVLHLDLLKTYLSSVIQERNSSILCLCGMKSMQMFIPTFPFRGDIPYFQIRNTILVIVCSSSLTSYLNRFYSMLSIPGVNLLFIFTVGLFIFLFAGRFYLQRIYKFSFYISVVNFAKADFHLQY